MAQKLNSQYGYSYDNLKVLLGGWSAWKEKNASDPNGYPIETTAGTTPGAGSDGQVKIDAPGIVVVTPGSTPAGTPVP